MKKNNFKEIIDNIYLTAFTTKLDKDLVQILIDSVDYINSNKEDDTYICLIDDLFENKVKINKLSRERLEEKDKYFLSNLINYLRNKTTCLYLEFPSINN